MLRLLKQAFAPRPVVNEPSLEDLRAYCENVSTAMTTGMGMAAESKRRNAEERQARLDRLYKFRAEKYSWLLASDREIVAL